MRFIACILLLLGAAFAAACEPVIGVSSSRTETDVRTPARVCDAVEMAGGVPLVLPMTAERKGITSMLDRVDALVMVGGADIVPARYGDTDLSDTVYTDPERDEFDALLIREAVARKMPILGICRGHQFINVVFGGTLWQDIPSQYPSYRDVPMSSEQEPFHRKPHEITLVPGTRLAEIFGTESLTVNSGHHQAVREIGVPFFAAARAEDGVIEAIESELYPNIISIQWHPESMNPVQLEPFRALVNMAKDVKKQE